MSQAVELERCVCVCGGGEIELVTAKDYRGKMGLREGGVQLRGEELLGPSGCWALARGERCGEK